MLRENRIYVLPSGRGMLFLTCIVVLILTAATYNNNLIFILSFFLCSLMVVAMLQTHANLQGVQVRFLSADEAFAGEPLTLLLQLSQRRRRAKRNLHVKIHPRSVQWKMVVPAVEDFSSSESIKPIRLAIQSGKRGIFLVPDLILETYYPLGLFRAWKVFGSADELVVYPAPLGSERLPMFHANKGEEELGLGPSPEGDFGELKNYRSGESYHQIAWKHYARSGMLYSKVHWGDQYKHYKISLPENTTHENLENQLSQMSAWIRQALNEDATFEMEIPTEKISPGSGLEQARSCWRVLARVQGAA